MVSLWPFRSADQSPASFEKTLSRLSTQIAAAATTLDTRRQQARRLRALWTLYASVAYLIYLIVALLVVGWPAWTPVEYAAAGGAPAAIYAVRRALDAATKWRVGAAEARLAELHQQRDTTIRELKAATRYDRTQELLDKYEGGKKKRTSGGGPGTGSDDTHDDEDSSGGKTGKPSPRPQPRTGFAPPPTANIPGRRPPYAGGPLPGSPPAMSPDRLAPSASFAPNAFAPGAAPSPPISPASPGSIALPSPLGPSPAAAAPPAWYDRLLDVLLGDDESAPRNRLALLCTSCGLVNGLAPPGARTLAEVGRWRCSGCGAANGPSPADTAGRRPPGETHARDPQHGADEDAERQRDVDEVRRATGLSREEVEAMMPPRAAAQKQRKARRVEEESDEEDEEQEQDSQQEADSSEPEAAVGAGAVPASAMHAAATTARESTPARSTRSRTKGERK